MKLAVVLIRGRIGARQDVKDTLDMLRLRKKHTCVVLESTPNHQGMLQKAKDFITFGPVKDETLAALAKARKPVHEGSLTVYNLAPPRGGFERKGIKKTFTQGGVLGPRKEIDTLITKMI